MIYRTPYDSIRCCWSWRLVNICIINACEAMKFCFSLKLWAIRKFYWFKMKSAACALENTSFRRLLFLDPVEKFGILLCSSWLIALLACRRKGSSYSQSTSSTSCVQSVELVHHCHFLCCTISEFQWRRKCEFGVDTELHIKVTADLYLYNWKQNLILMISCFKRWKVSFKDPLKKAPVHSISCTIKIELYSFQFYILCTEPLKWRQFADAPGK